MSKIKILYTIPNFDTAGSGQAMLKVAMGLNKELFDPEIVCFHDRGIFYKTVLESGIPVHLMQYTSAARPIFKCLKECWEKAKFFKAYDIVHSFHYGPDYTEGLAVRMAGCKWVFTKKNMNWGGSSDKAWKLRSRLAHRIVLQNHDMERLFYPGSNKTFYLPCGVDIDEFYPREKDLSLLAELNELGFAIRENSKVIMTIANLVPVKNIELMIKAFAAIKHPDSVFVIVGENKNEYGDMLANLSRELKVDNKVFFVGKRMDIYRFLTLADLFILASFKEGFPVALLEAMASGVLAVASEIPGVREQLERFPELLFESGNAEMLTSKIDWALYLDNQTRKEYTERLVANVRDNMSTQKEIRRHEELYLSLMNQK